MQHPRLFFVAPSAVHLSLVYDGPTNTWRAKACSVRSHDGQEFVTDEGRTYEFLTPGEALDVACAELAGRLGV